MIKKSAKVKAYEKRKFFFFLLLFGILLSFTFSIFHFLTEVATSSGAQFSWPAFFQHFLFNFALLLSFIFILSAFFQKMIAKPLMQLSEETSEYINRYMERSPIDQSHIFDHQPMRSPGSDLYPKGSIPSLIEIVGQLQSSFRAFKESFEISLARQVESEIEKAEAKIEIERERNEKHYYRRMELLGRLTAQVAHDFNNLIFLASLKTDALERKLQPEHRKMTQQIRSILHHSKDVIEQLLNYVKQTPLDRQKYVLTDLIVDLVPLFETALGRRFHLNVQGLENESEVFIEKVSFSSAMLNLLINARDAQQHGGEINLVIQDLSLDGKNWCKLSIADSGTGIPKEIQGRIFEPLFTTKSSGHGTGLGLPQVKEAIESFGGWIEFTTAPHQGTTFIVYLPRYEVHPDIIAQKRSAQSEA